MLEEHQCELITWIDTEWDALASYQEDIIPNHIKYYDHTWRGGFVEPFYMDDDED